MTRLTIDFGIDLGTTNSAIAVLKGVSSEIIKSNADADITPSVVSIDKNGTVHVGQRAKNKLIANSKDAYAEFKRRMGTDHLYEFKSGVMTKKPEELSAEVLKSLRADVQQRTGELVEAVVITVPAAFELHQCEATRKAAQLAGFKESPLLQEPVAAALAHGFQANESGAYWLVYDFGGGTFDAAVIKAEEGTIHVVNHGGDNFLGGSDIDWAIVEQVLAPRVLKDYGLHDFTRGNRKWATAFALMKRAAEIAKIELSRCERTTLDTCKFSGDSGEEIEFDCELTQAEVVRIAEPIVLKSVEICTRVLKEKNLGREAIEKVILVGGPTLAPYFRAILERSLSIPLDYSVDPLTVVARGAAVFAGTQRYNVRAGEPVAAGEFSIDLKYKPVGIDDAPTIGGKISSSEVQDFTGFTLELVNNKTQWRSGKISLRPDGVFIANLFAERGVRNTYSIEMLDPEGRKQKTTPDSLAYTIGAVVDEQPLTNSLGIALANNEYDRLFEKGRGLPLKATRDYRTVVSIRQGQSGDVLRCPVVEGENDKADRNRLVGYVTINGANVRRDLPAGSEVEVTLRIDEARIVTVNAYVPSLDEEFPAKLDMKTGAIGADFLKADYETELKRFREVRTKAVNAGGDTADETVRSIEESPLMQEIKQTLAASKADPDAAAKCQKLLLELKIKLDEAADSLEWPSLLCEAKVEIEDLKGIMERHGTGSQREKGESLISETNSIMRDRQADRLRRKIEELRRSYWEIVLAQPAFWVGQLSELEKKKASMTDSARAARLLEQGQEFQFKNNLPGLQNVVRQLWDLLPKEILEEVKRGYQSGLVR